VVEPTAMDRAEALRELKRKLDVMPDDGDWMTWGRWFLADPATRAISPFSKMTLAEYVEIRIEEHTAESLAEAERLAAGPLHEKAHALAASYRVWTNALALAQTGKPGEAEPLFRERLTSLRGAVAADNPILADALAGLTSSLLDQGKHVEAEPFARE